jgi:hypothetical protein
MDETGSAFGTEDLELHERQNSAADPDIVARKNGRTLRVEVKGSEDVQHARPMRRWIRRARAETAFGWGLAGLLRRLTASV